MAQYKVIIKSNDTQKLEDLTSKKAALENLILISENNPLVHNEELYQRFISDYEHTSSEIDRHWDYICKEYDIVKLEDCELYMDFHSCTVSNKKIE